MPESRHYPHDPRVGKRSGIWAILHHFSLAGLFAIAVVMKPATVAATTVTLLFCSLFAGLTRAAEEAYDVVVYGGTSSGVIAAVQAGRMSKSVVLIEPTRHLGGMTTGGLGATDTGNEKAIGGVSREFYRRIFKHYQDKAAWKYETAAEYQKRERYYRDDALFGFEPHVAEQIYNQMTAEAHVKIELGQRLDLKDGIRKEGQRIVSIRVEGGRMFAGKMFIDATYEGDLMARAGVSYTVGRESNKQYGETINGIEAARAKSHQFVKPVDPFVRAGNPASGLLPFIHPGSPGEDEEADQRVQAYNYRICMSSVAENRVPFPRPQGYEEKDYELLLRAFEAGAVNGARGVHEACPTTKPTATTPVPSPRILSAWRITTPTLTMPSERKSPPPTFGTCRACYGQLPTIRACPSGSALRQASGGWQRTSSQIMETGRTSFTCAKRAEW